jgi:DNA topoisomerase-1
VPFAGKNPFGGIDMAAATAKSAPSKNTAGAKKPPAAKCTSTKLVIVESPAKAKTIGKFLGRGYKVVASNGHIRDLPKSQIGVDVENGFEPHYITLRGRGEVLETIRKEAKNASKIYLATDPDREGEAISWHLASILKMNEQDKCRIVFNEITPAAVKNAIKQPRSIDLQLVDAQQGRRILDRLVGYKISPILWAKVRKGLSAGRVQSVATRIICDRENEIREFEPVEYWNITANLLEGNSRKMFEAKFQGKGGKKIEVNSQEQAEKIVAELQGAEYVALDVKKGEKARRPAPPFTTSNLQQEASRKLNFTTKRTMRVAQDLYEGVDIGKGNTIGLVTYIRTDSVRTAQEAIEQVREAILQRYGETYLPEKPNYFKGRKNAQDAHEAIRPTHMELTPESIKAAVSADQYKLYKLIYERFVASQMADARYETMTVSIDAAGYDFKATGSRVLFEGYIKVYSEGRDDGKGEKQTMLPAMEKGEKFECKELKKEQFFTQPPQRYTEASLVKTLEELGIGRPSTYAPTITTIIERGYVRREKKALFPTELGEIVTKLMKENFQDIVDIKFTANMEEQLDEVEEGKCDYKKLLTEFYGPFKKSLDAAEQSIEKVSIADEVSDVQCEKCGAMMVYKMGRFGKFLACPNFPECRNTKAIVEYIAAPCPKCGARLIKRKARKGGRIFFGCEKYPECDFTSWDEPAEQKCPRCGAYMTYKGYKNGRELRCSNKDCGYAEKLTQGSEGKENE